jgi:NAD(P)-dependent dehydrogenase (short-subunit alcohol dehydrogenase family)
MKTAVISGVGPIEGLGAQLCMRFAKKGLHVLAAGRTQERLDNVVSLVTSNGGSAEAVIADSTDETATEALFDRAGSDLDVAIYNTGNNTPGRIADMSADFFENSWRVCCFGGFLFGKAAVNRFAGKGGTLIFTGASASLRGRENFGAFNSSKGALRNLAQAMAKEYGRDGVHVGHVVIDGPIGGEKIMKGLPAYAEKLGPQGMISIEGIVDGYDYLYSQPPRAWTFELDVRTSVEKW